jgi:fructokinase
LFGEALFDCFPDGSHVLGGAPFNVAWHLQAFGFHPLFISRVGDDELGQEIKARMQKWGMRMDGIQTDPVHATGTVDVVLQDGEPTFHIVADCAYDHIAADQLPDIQADLIYHGSLAVRHAESLEALNRLKQLVHAPVFVDINLRIPWWRPAEAISLLTGARWAKLNEHEVDELADAGESLTSKAYTLVRRCGLESLILTLGKKGAYVIGPDGETPRVEPSSGESVVDTVGAGDAFASICIVGLINNWDINTTLQRAQQFASAVVGIRGATTEEESFYRPFLGQWNLASSNA